MHIKCVRHIVIPYHVPLSAYYEINSVHEWFPIVQRRRTTVLLHYIISTHVDIMGCCCQTITSLAMCSSITRDASACVRIDSVSTSCSIHTRVATAFVDVYKNTIKCLNIWNVNCINIYTIIIFKYVFPCSQITGRDYCSIISGDISNNSFRLTFLSLERSLFGVVHF